MNVLSLSVLDQFFATDAVDGVQFILHYDAPLDPKRVEAAFHKTARQFVGVHGTLVALDDHRLGVDLSSEAAKVHVLQVEDRAAAKQAVVPFVSRIGGPLADAYVFTRADGGTSIAFNVSHGLADGYGCFLFLAAWAAESRGQAAPPPYCDRELIRASETGATQDVSRSGVLRSAGFTLLAQDTRGPRLSWLERVRSAASFQAPGASDQRLSHNDVLCATLWKEAEADAEERPSHFVCATDVRRQLGPAGAMYFGNATLIATIATTTGELRDADTITVATWIRDTVAGVPLKMNDALAELEQVRAAHGLALLPCVRTMPEQGFSLTNLSRVPFSMLDFGVGAPAGVDLTAEAPRQPCSLVLPAGKDLRLMETRRAPRLPG
jgi:hypothetical protein